MIILSMRARRMLMSGCQGFLASVMDPKKIEKNKPEGVSIV